MIKCVIFDFGDTLVQTRLANKKTTKNRPELKLLKDKGFQITKSQLDKATQRMLEETKDLTIQQKQNDKTIFARTLLQELGINPSKKLAIECENLYYSELRKNMKLMPNAVKLLEFLKQKKIMACVLSNTRIGSNLIVAKKLGIRKYFKHFIMSHLFGSVKSELKIYNHLLERINKERSPNILQENGLQGINEENDP